ncbi:MAG TPA: hypothetical protein VNP03_10690 [Pseudonocardia sp.]|nr:hypothetical protein [Pseudonocardia sp.]
MERGTGADGDWDLARTLAAMPVTCRRLLDRHLPGADGLCRGCYSQVRLAHRWPCVLYQAAIIADRIADGIE